MAQNHAKSCKYRSKSCKIITNFTQIRIYTHTRGVLCKCFQILSKCWTKTIKCFAKSVKKCPKSPKNAVFCSFFAHFQPFFAYMGDQGGFSLKIARNFQYLLVFAHIFMISSPNSTKTHLKSSNDCQIHTRSPTSHTAAQFTSKSVVIMMISFFFGSITPISQPFSYQFTSLTYVPATDDLDSYRCYNSSNHIGR